METGRMTKSETENFKKNEEERFCVRKYHETFFLLRLPVMNDMLNG